jgi:hypothetical protein
LLWDFCFETWVFSFSPIILIANICPSYLLVEEIVSRKHLFLSIRDRFLNSLSLVIILFLIQILSTVQVSSIGLLPILIERVSRNLQYFIRTIKLFHENSPLGKRQESNFVTQYLLILLRLIQAAIISLPILIQFEVLLHLLKGIEILILNGLHFFPFPLSPNLLHISFTIFTIITS